MVLSIINQIIRTIKEEKLHEMGTTATVLTISDGSFQVLHIGDSRAYLYRDGALRLLTIDHAGCGRHSHDLTQYLGIVSEDDAELEPYCITEPVSPGDIFLLCSDGLTGEVSQDELSGLISAYKEEPAERLVLRVIKQAVDNGSRDNVSAVIIKVF